MAPRCGICSNAIARCGDESRRRKPCRSLDRRPGEFIQTNIVGTFTLLQEALRHWRGLDAARSASASASITFRPMRSSARSATSGLFTETTPYAPNSPYSASKARSDHLVRAWHETYGLPTLVTNCSNNYGPYHFPEKLIPHIIIKGLDERAAAGLRRRPERARLALCRGSREALALVVSAGVSARPTMSAGATSAPTFRW